MAEKKEIIIPISDENEDWMATLRKRKRVRRELERELMEGEQSPTAQFMSREASLLESDPGIRRKVASVSRAIQRAAGDLTRNGDSVLRKVGNKILRASSFYLGEKDGVYRFQIAGREMSAFKEAIRNNPEYAGTFPRIASTIDDFVAATAHNWNWNVYRVIPNRDGLEISFVGD